MIKDLQKQIREGKRIALKCAGYSNTTRSKSYNKRGSTLDLTRFNHIKIDPQKRVAFAETRATMQQLVRTTLSHGLIPPVVPEFKGITVGGAIMGCAAESGSHKWGIFSDICFSYQLILGNGELISASPTENVDLFHAIPGSYGSLGLLISAEISLIPASTSIRLKWRQVSEPLFSSSADFVDGIVFSKNKIVMLEGMFTNDAPTATHWYFEKAKEAGEIVLPLFEYLFRYDPGAFWIGRYLLKLSFLFRFVTEGLLKLPSKHPLKEFHNLPTPSRFWLNLMSSQRLWKLHHKAEKWIQNHIVIQDCCLPISHATAFIHEVMEYPSVFPLWLCPIKNASTQQIFAPHALTEPVLNVGIYGLPKHPASMEEITRYLEQKTCFYGGRKVLYSRSYYSVNEFWRIYDYDAYQKLRHKTSAEKIWPSINEKVLSE